MSKYIVVNGEIQNVKVLAKDGKMAWVKCPGCTWYMTDEKLVIPADQIYNSYIKALIYKRKQEISFFESKLETLQKLVERNLCEVRHLSGVSPHAD